MMKTKKKTDTSCFGFNFEKGGAHTARTMMLEDMSLLLSCVNQPTATKKDYLTAIQDDNCLGKRSGRSRVLTVRHLVALYSLDPEVTLFRALLYFWRRDTEGQPLLALLCAYARDPLLRMSSPFIFQFPEGAAVTREALEEYLETTFPGRFSNATLKSTAQNLNGTWTSSGHLTGKARKVRARATATAGSVAYALFLGYLTGGRGASLFESEYARLLDCPKERAIELAEEASRHGWIVFKRVGNVMEVLFPNNLTELEKEWIRDQY